MTHGIEAAGWHPRTFAESNLKAGALVGVIGAAVMGVFAVASGGLLLVPAVALLIGGVAEEAPLLAVLSGLVVHFSFGALFGAVFAVLYTFLTQKYSLGTGIALGIVYGILLYLVNFALVGQALHLGLLSIPGAIAISSHIVFGAVVGFYPVLAAKD